VQTDEARKHATAILKDVIRNYPSTREGHLSRARLAAGFPPLIPETPLVATPPPATPSPAAANSPEAAPSPAGSPAPQMNPSGTPPVERATSSASPAPSSSP